MLEKQNGIRDVLPDARNGRVFARVPWKDPVVRIRIGREPLDRYCPAFPKTNRFQVCFELLALRTSQGGPIWKSREKCVVYLGDGRCPHPLEQYLDANLLKGARTQVAPRQVAPMVFEPSDKGGPGARDKQLVAAG